MIPDFLSWQFGEVFALAFVLAGVVLVAFLLWGPLPRGGKP